MYDLRDYQIEPTQVGADYFKRQGEKPSIIVAPTAFGKSIVIAHIANQLDGKAIVLQPSKELLEQNYNKLIGMGGKASIYSASFNTKEFGDITYATIGSIKALGAVFKDKGFKYMIVDEAHLFPREPDSMFRKFVSDAGIKSILGLTATPFKLQTNTDIDGFSFSKLQMLTSRSKKGVLFKEILHVTQIKEIIDRGYWSKLEYELYDFDTGELVYNSTKAEYTEESIQKAYENQSISTKIKRAVGSSDRKRILVFVPSVADAKDLAKQTLNSAAVYADMPPKERAQIIADFRSGKIRVIYNVNILSVGFDDPEVDHIIHGRPTASLAWFYQATGRGTRIHPLKKDCLITDFVGNVEKFGRLEDLYFKFQEGSWKLFGTDGRLLTGIPLHEIGEHKDLDLIPIEDRKIIIPFGKHKGKLVKDVPLNYLNWMLKEVDFSKCKEVKEEIMRLKALK